MYLPVTAFYTGLLACVYIIISLMVATYRFMFGIMYGDDDHKTLIHWIRAQGNPTFKPLPLACLKPVICRIKTIFMLSSAVIVVITERRPQDTDPVD